VLDRESLAITRWAGDCRALLGVEPGRILSSTLSELFDQRTVDRIKGRLARREQRVPPSMLLNAWPHRVSSAVDLTIHADGDIAMIEVERAPQTRRDVGDPLTRLRDMLATTQSAQSLADFIAAAATAVRSATGFDRVMVYRFVEDGSGAVVAEDTAEGMEPFIGLHYPASDIPQQARELYRRNWLRLITNVDYAPAALTPSLDPLSGQPLDMSQCVLRSVSPVHLEYLRNMGVAASMSISILRKDRLWGLIACHHRYPCRLSADRRVAAELFGQVFSLELEAKEDAEAAGCCLVARDMLDKLACRARSSEDVIPDLTRDRLLLDLVSASGAAVVCDGETRVVGVTPPDDLIDPLVGWLNGREGPVYRTACLAEDFPPAASHADKASGLLAVLVSRAPDVRVLWFRPEVVRSVVWAGDPGKPAELDPSGERLTPRRSFEAWREEKRMHARPWTDLEVETGRALQIVLTEAVLQQTLSSERQAGEAERELLMAELAHRVKNLLANIQALVQQTKRGRTSLEEYVVALEGRIHAMAHAHDLLAASRWEGATLRSLVEEEVAPFSDAEAGNITLAGEEVRLTPRAALPISLLIHELVTNAAKYGALTNRNGHVDITWGMDPERRRLELDWRERGGPPAVAPKRRGFGTRLIERTLIGLHGSARLSFEPEGLTCAVAIPAGDLTPSPPKAAPANPPA
jgi:light-regulated signal transduction histidine kinase (bacteriophytochrome)